jgi:sulfatase modifying factor 1
MSYKQTALLISLPVIAATLASALLFSGCATTPRQTTDAQISAQRGPSSAGRGAGGVEHKRTPEQIEALASHWRLTHGTSWQRLTNPETDARTQAPSEASPDGVVCSHPGMLHVEGKMVSGPLEMYLEKKTPICTRWVNNIDDWQGSIPPKCAEYSRDKWQKQIQAFPRKELSFCMDKFEYPNVEGQNPAIMMTFPEAEDACRSQGKRLCGEEEWTFACEGEEAFPYPNGYERDGADCNHDLNPREWDGHALVSHRTSPTSAAELESLWQGKPSGSMQTCVSPFGIHDMTGNIDEWTRATRSRPGFTGAQKGGWWGPIRARCRPVTSAHDDQHLLYQQGTRCCSDH